MSDTHRDDRTALPTRCRTVPGDRAADEDGTDPDSEADTEPDSDGPEDAPVGSDGTDAVPGDSEDDYGPGRGYGPTPRSGGPGPAGAADGDDPAAGTAVDASEDRSDGDGREAATSGDGSDDDGGGDGDDDDRDGDADDDEEEERFLDPGPAPDLRLGDVSGLTEQKATIESTLFRTLDRPDLGEFGTNSVMFYGPTGAGKRRLARAVAGELGARGFRYDEVRTLRRTGNSLDGIEELLENAREAAPVVVLLDCFDEIHHMGAVHEFARKLEAIRTDGVPVVILGVIKEDRFRREAHARYVQAFGLRMHLEAPDRDRRRAVLRAALSAAADRGPVETAVDGETLDRIAVGTDGFAVDDLRLLVRRAVQSVAGDTDADPSGGPDGGTTGDGGDADGSDGPAAGAGDEARPDSTPSSSDDAGDRSVPVLDGTTLETVAERVDDERLDSVLAETALSEVDVSAVGFEDVGGLEEAKERLRELLYMPLNHAPAFEAYDVATDRGVLLHGPPGNGKTLLAKAVANETGRTFISVTGPELKNAHGSGTERRLRGLFETARRNAPSVVFFDEFDSVATRRGKAEAGTDVVNTLLTELDGLRDNDDVVVMAATNRMDTLDPALLRPGRFEHLVEVGAPDAPARREIFEIHMDAPTATNVTPEWFGTVTDDGLSGAAIADVCDAATVNAIRRAGDGLDGADAGDGGPAGEGTEDPVDVTVTRRDVREAIEEYEATREFRADDSGRMYR